MARYVPVAIKLALLKKKRMAYLQEEDEAKLHTRQQQLTPAFMMLAPRPLTTKEAQKSQKYFSESGTGFELDYSKSGTLNDRKQVAEIESELKAKLQEVFEDRINLREQLFNDKLRSELGLLPEEPKKRKMVKVEAAVSEDEEDIF